MAIAGRVFRMLLASGLLVLIGCRKEFRPYRFLDHLDAENVVASPLISLDASFKTVNQTWSEDEMTLLEGGNGRTRAVPTESLLLGWLSQETPEGMAVYRNEEKLEFASELEEGKTAWTWSRVTEVIEPEIYPEHKKFKRDAVLLSKNQYFVSPEIFLPGGETLFEITAFSLNGMEYLPQLEIYLNEEYIGEIPVFGYQKYHFIHKVDTGRYRIKLGFSTTLDRAPHTRPPELLLDRISVSCSRDLILISAPVGEQPDKRAQYRAVYSVQPSRNFIFPADVDPEKKHFLPLRLNARRFVQKKLMLRAGQNTFEVFGFTRERGTFLRLWLNDKRIGIKAVRPWRWNSFLFRADVEEGGEYSLRLEWRNPGKITPTDHTFDVHNILHRGPDLTRWLPLHRLKYGSHNHDSGIGENPYNLKKKLEVNDYDLNAILAPPASELTFEIKIPPAAYLQFGYGTQWQAGDSESDRVRFRVLLENSGGRKMLFDRTLAPDAESDTRSILRDEIDLSEFAGNKVGISFMTECPPSRGSPANSREGQTAFWINPVLHSRPAGTDAGGSGGPAKIILISLDTLRADHLGCFGYDRPTSPHLDKLAGDGVLFSNCFSQAPYTISSHMSMLTGLNPSRHRVYSMEDSLSTEIETLADRLRARGYSTAAFTGGGQVSHIFGFSKGFDSYQERTESISSGSGIPQLLQMFEAWIDRHRDQSFFLFLHTYQLHDPYSPPAPYNRIFADAQARWTEVFMSREVLDLRRLRFKDLAAAEKRNIVALYDGEIRYTDEGLIKPLLDQLREQGLYDQTMIIVTSDHGEEFFDHGSWLHSSNLYNELIHVPLLIKFPGSRYGGRKIDAVVRLLDIMPTILEAAGAGASTRDLDGRSLLKLIQGKESGERVFFSEIKNVPDIPDRIAAGRGEHKLIFNQEYTEAEASVYDPRPISPAIVELFNLIRDPSEKVNLAEKAAAPARKLMEEIAAYRAAAEALLKKKGAVTIDKQLRERLKALGYLK